MQEVRLWLGPSYSRLRAGGLIGLWCGAFLTPVRTEDSQGADRVSRFPVSSRGPGPRLPVGSDSEVNNRGYGDAYVRLLGGHCQGRGRHCWS
ncbi:hypothetical protein LXA43DRAFT_1012777, partial [Ganoderma leucocontextum]